jgi:hypothetical protein
VEAAVAGAAGGVVLSDDFARAQEDLRPLAIALVVGAVLGFSIGWAAQGNDSGRDDRSNRAAVAGGARGPATVPRNALPDALSTEALLGALRSAVDPERDGTVQAAVQVQGQQPVVRTQGQAERMRMWSMSKVPTAIAALREIDDRSPELDAALEDAIVRSGNCAQRRVVLELQRATGGTEGAGAAIAKVFDEAEAPTVEVPREAMPPEDDSCRDGSHDVSGDAPQVGASTWTIADAVAFADALGTGVYGDEGREVLELMRREKEPSPDLDNPEQEYTADPDWGAGRALEEWDPAYKAGWGGVLDGMFVAGQIAIVEVGGRSVAMAVAYRPHAQPQNNDPGKTEAPEAIEAVFRELAAQFESVQDR